MNNFVIRYRIITDRGSGFVNGNFISVYWDDVAMDEVVYKYTDALDTVGSIITSGPDLGALRHDYDTVSSGRIEYKFCSGTTLNTFVIDSIFPYTEKREIANHFSCNIVVCDLRIIGAATTDATDTITPDGRIVISVDTSSPPAKYSLLSDFSDGGQSSNEFTGILAGNYTVYVKDNRGCSASVSVLVGTPTTYGPKYRLEYYDLNEMKTRIDVLERGYSGEIIEVCGSDDPFILNYNADGELNKFTPIVPSQATLTLISPSNFYFRELFSQDERKYRLDYYKDFGRVIPEQHNIPPLVEFTGHDGGGGGPHWSTGPTPFINMSPTDDQTEYLVAAVSLDVGSYDITYNVDVANNSVEVWFQLFYGTDDENILNTSYVLVASPGTNAGTFTISPSTFVNGLFIFARQKPAALPNLSTWQSKEEINRIAWTLGASPSITLHAVSGFSFSQNLYVAYPFVAGQTYTIQAQIAKNVISGSPNTNVYFAGRTDSFFAVYSPFGQMMNGGTGTYNMSITFTAPAGMTIFSMQLYVTGVEATIIFTVNSIQISSTSVPGAYVAFLELSNDIAASVVGFEKKWTGFVISSNYIEPYKSDPYPVTITATDGLVDLKNKDFTDRYGNKFTSDIVTLNSIASILQKTDLGLNIVTAVNRLEVSMTNNALTESKFDPGTFYDDSGKITNCYDALGSIIKTFGVRIFQRNAQWLIMTIEEAVHEFSAMEFNASGVFVQNLRIQDITAITGPTPTQNAAFISVDQNLEVVPAYGVFYFEHSLIENPSLVKSYSFENTDVFITPDGVTAFKAWNINIGNAPGSEYGIKETRSFDGAYNFYWKVPYVPFAEPGWTLTLTSTEGLVEYAATDLLEFKFDYSLLTGKLINNPYAAKPHYAFWVRLKWSLRIGSYYFDDITGEWTTAKKYNDIYVDQYNDPQNFKLVLPPREVSSLTVEAFQVEFVLYDNNVFDCIINGSDYSQLDSISTVDLSIGYRIKGKVIYTTARGQTIRYLYWQLNDEDSTSDGDVTRRPSDYDEETNQKVWVLQENSMVRRSVPRGGENYRPETPSPEIPITYVYLDNVVLRLLPGGTEPPSNITIQRDNNLNIKIDYSDTFTLNDIDIDNINNSERTYKNYFKKLDGTPTQVWQRTYRSGQGKLMELYSGDFLSQYKDPGNKLTGSMILKNEITFATVLRELFDSNKLYMLMGMELHDRQYSIVFDMLELKDVVNDDKSDAVDAEFTIDFSLDFRA